MKNSTSVIATTLLATALLLAAGATHAADLYRWRDSQGFTHLADTVPEEYRSVATRVDSSTFDLTPEELMAGEKRRQALLDQASRVGTGTPRAAYPVPQRPPVQTASTAGGIRPQSSIGPDQARCAALRQRFDQSKSCYARFVQVNGSLRPGAITACGPSLTNPDVECGATGPSQ